MAQPGVAIHAVLWAALRAAGADTTAVSEYGRLFSVGEGSER
jgi:hypothetical protein